MNFNVTFQTVTPESCEIGDFESIGFCSENVSLRDALSDMDCDGCDIDANCYPVNPHYVSWVTAYKVSENFLTGEIEDRALHFPSNITVSSKRRILHLLGIKTSN